MKEIDLRCKKIGSYEFSFTEDDAMIITPEITICKIPQEDDYKYSFFFSGETRPSRIGVKSSTKNGGNNYIEIVSEEGEVAHFLI